MAGLPPLFGIRAAVIEYGARRDGARPPPRSAGRGGSRLPPGFWNVGVINLWHPGVMLTVAVVGGAYLLGVAGPWRRHFPDAAPVPGRQIALITFVHHPAHLFYVRAPRVFGITPLEDQALGGLVMRIGSMTAYFTCAFAAFFRWAGRETVAGRRIDPIPEGGGIRPRVPEAAPGPGTAAEPASAAPGPAATTHRF